MKLHWVKNALKLTLYRMGLLPSPWQMYSANKLIELEAVLSHLTPVSSGAILDVCCGSGIPTHSLAKRAPGAIGVDLDEDGLRSAEWHRTHSNARSRLRFVGGDAERLPFTDGSFPAVVSFCSIEHTSDPLKMAQEAWRVLRDGGEFVLTADSLGNVDPTFPREEHARMYFVNSYYSVDTLRSVLETAGFTVESCYPILRSQLAVDELRRSMNDSRARPFRTWVTFRRLKAAEKRHSLEQPGLFIFAKARKMEGASA